MQHQMFDGVDHVVGAAGVEDGVGGVIDEALHPLRGDAATAAGPGVFGSQAGASHHKLEARVAGLQGKKFFGEDDVAGGSHRVENGDTGIQILLGGLADEATEGRHARAAGHANEVLAWRVEHRQEAAGRRDDEHAVTGLDPVHDAGAHLAIALHGDLVVASIQRA